MTDLIHSFDIARQKVARKEDVWHLIRKGIVMQLHMDLETYSLEKHFAGLISYGDALGDIAGNLYSEQEIHIKRPDRYLPMPKSLLVTQTFFSDLDDSTRTPLREAMGRIAHRFEKGLDILDRIPLDEEEVTFSTVTKRGAKTSRKHHTETVRMFPLTDADGKVVHDVRYHPERKKLAYKFSPDHTDPYFDNIENLYYEDANDGSRWKFVEPKLLVSGYRVKWFDFHVLRTNLLRAGFHPRNIFFTHSRAAITDRQRQKNLAVDNYSAVTNSYLFGRQGEEGLHVSQRVDPRNGETVFSLKLEKTAEANTRYENTLRGVREGMFMPDGSLFDQPKGHRSPCYDAKASFALYNYQRQINPDIIRALEVQSDEAELRNFLQTTSLSDTVPPIYSMVRSRYPDGPSAEPVAFLGFDDRMGQMRNAMMIRLDGDLAHYRHKGKTLLQMQPTELLQMLRDQRGNAESLVRIEKMRRFPGAFHIQDTFNSRAAADWDLEQIDDNFRFLMQNPGLCENIRSAVEMFQWDSLTQPDNPNPLLEEEFGSNGFGDLDYLESKVKAEQNDPVRRKLRPERGQVSSTAELIYNKAMDIYFHTNLVDELLHRLALQPHPVEYSDKDTHLGNYQELCRRIQRKFSEKNIPYHHVFHSLLNAKGKIEINSPEQARQFRWQLLTRYLNDDERERADHKSLFYQGIFDPDSRRSDRLIFANCSRNFRLVDKAGRELSLGDAEKLHPNLVQENLQSGKWKIQFYRMRSEPSITATLFQFADMNEMGRMPEVWRDRYAALRNLYLNGPPNELPSNMRFSALPVAEDELRRLEVNAPYGSEKTLGPHRNVSEFETGDADVYMQGEEAHRILADYRKSLQKLKRGNKRTDDMQRRTHYDPDSGLPYDYIVHEIPYEQHVIVDVPDAHLRNPLRGDARLYPMALIVDVPDASQRKAIRAGKPVILRGQQTGRMYYGGNVSLHDSPKKAESSFGDFIDSARRAYEDEAGIVFPSGTRRKAMVIQELIPLANTRTVKPRMQAVKVPSIYFDGLVSPEMAAFNGPGSTDKPIKSFRGLALFADYVTQDIKAGKPIRFTEVAAPFGSRLDGETHPATGAIYESRNVSQVRVLPFGGIDAEGKPFGLRGEIASGKFSEREARHFGYAGCDDMVWKLTEAMRNRETQNPEHENILLISFDRVDKSSWAFFNPPRIPLAGFTFNGEPIPPSAYRWTGDKKPPVPYPDIATGKPVKREPAPAQT